MMNQTKKTNWVLTIVLILGTLTVFFPLYMAVIIDQRCGRSTFFPETVEL